MIGWVSPKTTQTGLRKRMRIWRWKTTKVSVGMSMAPVSGRGRDRFAVAQRAAGEGQEDVVQRRAADVHARRGQARPLQPEQQRRDGGGALVDGDVQRPGA